MFKQLAIIIRTIFGLSIVEIKYLLYIDADNDKQYVPESKLGVKKNLNNLAHLNEAEIVQLKYSKGRIV